MSARRVALWSGLVGVMSALVTLAVAELLALLLAPASSPLLAVGSFVIDIVPPWVKDTAIALFGTGDKIALLVGLGLAVLIAAVGVGLLEYFRRPFGAIVLGIIGVLAMLAVVTRAEATLIWAAPTVFGTAAGVLLLRLTMRRLREWADAGAESRTTSLTERRASVNRRGFLTLLGVSSAVAVVVGLGARTMNAARTAVNTARQALTLPGATTPAAVVPAGASLDVQGISPLFTPNANFYRIDTALQVPVIEASEWRLKVTGMVDREVEIGFDELLAMPLTETAVTLMCVSNEVGSDLIGNAMWLGYPIRELLAQAGPKSGADMVLSSSQDGWTASTPLDVLLDPERDCLLAVGMNGDPLPIEHGFPVRMVVPGLYGYVSATKWVVELNVTRFVDQTAYWTDRGWSALGPVKTSSRIDVPRSGATVMPGAVAVAGVAWAQHTGIDAVEVRVDGGTWQPARLADAISIDTWRQWVYEWDATVGDHTIEVRAKDSAGETQSGDRVPVVPDGAEGWHSIDVRVN